MNYRLKIALACLLAVSVNATYGANLLDVYEKAKQADPTIRQADANRLAAREGKPQALAALLPNVTATGSASKNKSEGSQPGTAFALTSIDFVSDTKRTAYGATLSQSLFHWDQWVALKRADAQVAQAEATYAAAEQDLIVRVAQRYFAVLAAQDNVDNTQ